MCFLVLGILTDYFYLQILLLHMFHENLTILLILPLHFVKIPTSHQARACSTYLPCSVILCFLNFLHIEFLHTATIHLLSCVIFFINSCLICNDVVIVICILQCYQHPHHIVSNRL